MQRLFYSTLKLSFLTMLALIMAVAEQARAASPQPDGSSLTTLEEDTHLRPGELWSSGPAWHPYGRGETCGRSVASPDGALRNELLASDLPVIVSFGARWCRPCRKMAPWLNELAKELRGRALVVKVNIDKRQRLAEQFDVTVVPTTVILRDGQEAARFTGFLSKAFLARQVGSGTSVARSRIRSAAARDFEDASAGRR